VWLGHRLVSQQVPNRGGEQIASTSARMDRAV